MTDRELLERAAHAYWADEIDDVCSVRWLEADNAIGYTHGDNQDHNGEDRERVWNPLEDDGDALRLAVALRIDVKWHSGLDDSVFAGVAYKQATQVRERLQGDNYAATRRAIVRAAAAMGEP
jgi:hypothetical protein